MLVHHPPYSDGSHKSDTEIEMAEMRQLYAPIWEAFGADIVFSGHSHGYERMAPTAGFTGLKAAWLDASVPGNATFAGVVTGGGGAAGGPAVGLPLVPQVHSKGSGTTPNGGTTYVVAGSGGQLSATATLAFPSLSRMAPQPVSCALDVGAVRLQLRRGAPCAGGRWWWWSSLATPRRAVPAHAWLTIPGALPSLTGRPPLMWPHCRRSSHLPPLPPPPRRTGA